MEIAEPAFFDSHRRDVSDLDLPWRLFPASLAHNLAHVPRRHSTERPALQDRTPAPQHVARVFEQKLRPPPFTRLDPHLAEARKRRHRILPPTEQIAQQRKAEMQPPLPQLFD